MSDISLLPKELRDKEEKAKQKAKEAEPLPDFSMHLPEKAEAAAAPSVENKPADAWGMEIGASQEEKPKGHFEIKHPHAQPAPPPLAVKKKEPIPMKPEPEKNIKPLVHPEPLKEKPRDFLKMHLPAAEQEGEADKKIVSQTADEVLDFQKSKSLFGFLKKDQRFLEHLKNPPANLNLMEEDIHKIIKIQFWKKMRSLLLLVLLLVIVFSLVFVGIKFYKLSLISEYNQRLENISQVEAEIKAFSQQQNQATQLKERATRVQELLSNHVYWTDFLADLEANTVTDVYFSNFIAQNSGQISLTAKAQNYQSVAEQLFVLQNADFVKSVEINAASKQGAGGETVGDEVSFNVNLSIDPDALKRQ